MAPAPAPSLAPTPGGAQFSADLLEQPAVQGASMVALAHLDAAAAAATRLTDPTDHDALHDFRVAIRRLRVTIRAYPGVRESIAKKQRRRLRRLARATNTARDTEVQLAWFRARLARFAPAERRALAPLRVRLRARRRREIARTQPELLRQFGKIERKLRRRLMAARDSGAHEAQFRGIAAATLVQYANDLSTRLRVLAPTSNATDVHATRIAAKRLRYLLEPLRAVLADAAPIVDRLKELQDLLGELTDGHTLEAVLQEAGNVAAAAGAEFLRAEAGRLFSTLRQSWSQAGPEFVRAIDVVAQQLRPVITAPVPPSLRQRARRRRQTATA